jgi:hypothetical protein
MYQNSQSMRAYYMDPYLDLSIWSHSEQFSSNEVTVILESTLLNSQSYYQVMSLSLQSLC